ncbi:hypothetical protein PS9374_04755 [Planomonospora sphaerica]|uniref:Uncharacterized protein n=1 Tax=Planomonospora sphaerica TaxID=161355 RepID=A0A171DJV1_9ACTN|nr:hypothetical protein [Planomonospora sphaerica]GAT69088.1 hypothetical protein PS9374_04755 [Planomonospora sphaerica]
MLDESITRYDDMLGLLGLDTFTYTVTIPETGVLTVEDAVRRIGGDPAVLYGGGQSEGGRALHLYQVGSGIVTLDWANPGDDRKQVTDRLAGDGFRHWYLSFDIEGNTVMYACYGQAEGWLEHPESGWIPFTDWTDQLGPLGAYTEFLLTAYGSEEAEAQVDITVACLAVIEAESSVRLDEALIDRPYSLLPDSGF